MAEVLSRLRAHILRAAAPTRRKTSTKPCRSGRGESERWLLPRASPVHGAAGAVEGATIVPGHHATARRFDELKNDPWPPWRMSFGRR